MQFCELLHENITDELFLRCNLWTDACFTREGVFNVPNGHLLIRDNPHIIHGRGCQFPSRSAFGLEPSGTRCVPPSADMLNAKIRRDFIETVLPGLLGDVSHVVLTARRSSSALLGTWAAVDQHDISGKVYRTSSADCMAHDCIIILIMFGEEYKL
jgi:hypothetical protein